jgi:NADPH2:quinone reductase
VGPRRSFTFTEVDAADPGPGQLRVTVETAGVNYFDIYQRQGAVAAPFVTGVEGVGRVTEVGSDVDAKWVGRRVGWLGSTG